MRKRVKESRKRKRERDDSQFYVCRHLFYDFMFNVILSDKAARRLADELERRIRSTSKRWYQGDPEPRRFIRQTIEYLRGKRGLF